VTAIDAVIVIIMRHFRFLIFVATSSEAGHGQDRGLKTNIPARNVVSVRPDETSIVMKPLAASQSPATAAARIERCKADDDRPASLILLTLR